MFLGIHTHIQCLHTLQHSVEIVPLVFRLMLHAGLAQFVLPSFKPD